MYQGALILVRSVLRSILTVIQVILGASANLPLGVPICGACSADDEGRAFPILVNGEFVESAVAIALITPPVRVSSVFVCPYEVTDHFGM